MLDGLEPLLASGIPQLELGGFPINMDHLRHIVKANRSTRIIIELILTRRLVLPTIAQGYNFHTLLNFLGSLLIGLYLHSGPE